MQDYLEQPSQEIGWNGAEPQQPRPKLWQGGKGGGRKGEAPRSRFAPVRTLFFLDDEPTPLIVYIDKKGFLSNPPF